MKGLVSKHKKTVKKYRKINKRLSKKAKKLASKKGGKNRSKTHRTKRYIKGGEPPYDEIATNIVKLIIEKQNISKPLEHAQLNLRIASNTIEEELAKNEEAQSEEYTQAMDEKKEAEEAIQQFRTVGLIERIEYLTQQIEAQKNELEKVYTSEYDINSIMELLTDYARTTILVKIATRNAGDYSAQSGVYEQNALAELGTQLEEQYKIVIDVLNLS